ncbi:MAG: metalloregulator ArsR/SmtB family transcription factor [Lachnospiraceae bacterium]|nr:metalloregulator ArsR/SmtB family transcription factor [Lachnospiraceae bacterium]
MTEDTICTCNNIHEEHDTAIAGNLPDNDTFDRLSKFFKVMGDPTRMRIMWVLHREEMCVCDLACTLGMTKSAISHQLAVLRDSDLVKNRRDGKTIYYSLSDEHVHLLYEAGLEHINE